MAKLFGIVALITLIGGLAYFVSTKETTMVLDPSAPGGEGAVLEVPEAEAPENFVAEGEVALAGAFAEPLKEPPVIIKAVYMTSWTAATPSRLDYIVSLVKGTEANAVVIDIKDYSGHVLYNSKLEDVKTYGALEPRIKDLDALLNRLHSENIYAIARLTVFQDPVLAAARPEWAVKTSSGAVWKDNKGLSWMDPASQQVWDYNIAIAREAAARGFDEINFDYIRFPSDGSLAAMRFPVYNAAEKEKNVVIREFYEYLNDAMKGVIISADLFGLATENKDGLGIGQVIENAYLNFDYVAPMVYPSHYANGYNGYANPAAYPYEIVKRAMQSGFARLIAVEEYSKPGRRGGKLRPWLQDFDLGADYDAAKIRAQMRAIDDGLCAALKEHAAARAAETASGTPPSLSSKAGSCEPGSPLYTVYVNGWMIWSPSNTYTAGGLLKE